MRNRILILLLLLLIAVAYSVISLILPIDSGQAENRLQSVFGLTSDIKNDNQSTNNSANLNTQNKHSTIALNKDLTSSTHGLPFYFDVVGIGELMRNQSPVPLKEIDVLIQFENELYEYLLNDYLLNSNMQLVNIEAKQITILYKHVLYTKVLARENLLDSTFRKTEKSYTELLQMTAEKIGTRPRIIEHFVDLTSTPYIADGKLVAPGLNPALFEQAGLKEDDVLKQINGKSVTIASEFEEIKNELKTAHTLKLLVMRRGRMITLYLDIPSEGLDLVRD